MNTFMTVMLIAYMIVPPALIFLRLVKDEGLPMRVLASGWPLVGAFGALVLGAVLGAEFMAFAQIEIGYLAEFVKQPQPAQFFVTPTLLNLVAVLVFLRWTAEALGDFVRLIKRDPMKAVKTT